MRRRLVCITEGIICEANSSFEYLKINDVNLLFEIFFYLPTNNGLIYKGEFLCFTLELSFEDN